MVQPAACPEPRRTRAVGSGLGAGACMVEACREASVVQDLLVEHGTIVTWAWDNSQSLGPWSVGGLPLACRFVGLYWYSVLCPYEQDCT